LAGNGGNGGRRRGSRNVLGQELIDALQADFRENGATVIATVRREDPAAYLTIVARLLPQEVAIGTPGDFASCDSADAVVDRLLADFADPHQALASFDAMRALLVERIAAQTREVLLAPPSRNARHAYS